MPREHSYSNGRIQRAEGDGAEPRAPEQKAAAEPKQQAAQQRPARQSAAYNPAEKRQGTGAAAGQSRRPQNVNARQSLYQEEYITINKRQAPQMEEDIFTLMGEKPMQTQRQEPAGFAGGRKNAQNSVQPANAPDGRRAANNANGTAGAGKSRTKAKKGSTDSGADNLLLGETPPVKRKSKRKKNAVLAALVLVVVLGTAVLLGVNYLAKVFDPGSLGILDKITMVGSDGTPKAYSKKDYLHILVVGIDNEEGRNYGAGLGLTDMLLYCRFDLKNNKLNMMQIPRDSYIGEEYPTGGTGKINALLIQGENKKNPIVNLTTPFQEKFQLPLDYYIAMDMDAMKEIVNTFGAIKVYVPRDMSHDGSALEAGWRWLDGDAAEFFVRNRYGPGFERGDIDRLDNQRHFYSALFRRFLNLTPKDVPGLLSVFHHYCNTDIPLNDLFSIAISALSLTAEDVMFCKAPGATGDGLDPTGKNRNNYYLDLYGRGTEEDPGLANLLNWYFRPEGDEVPAESLKLPQIKISENIALYPPNVQIMSSVQESEGGADVDVEPGA